MKLKMNGNLSVKGQERESCLEKMDLQMEGASTEEIKTVFNSIFDSMAGSTLTKEKVSISELTDKTKKIIKKEIPKATKSFKIKKKKLDNVIAPNFQRSLDSAMEARRKEEKGVWANPLNRIKQNIIDVLQD